MIKTVTEQIKKEIPTVEVVNVEARENKFFQRITLEVTIRQGNVYLIKEFTAPFDFDNPEADLEKAYEGLAVASYELIPLFKEKLRVHAQEAGVWKKHIVK